MYETGSVVRSRVDILSKILSLAELNGIVLFILFPFTVIYVYQSMHSSHVRTHACVLVVSILVCCDETYLCLLGNFLRSVLFSRWVRAL